MNTTVVIATFLSIVVGMFYMLKAFIINGMKSKETEEVLKIKKAEEEHAEDTVKEVKARLSQYVRKEKDEAEGAVKHVKDFLPKNLKNPKDDQTRES